MNAKEQHVLIVGASANWISSRIAEAGFQLALQDLEQAVHHCTLQVENLKEELCLYEKANPYGRRNKSDRKRAKRDRWL